MVPLGPLCSPVHRASREAASLYGHSKGLTVYRDRTGDRYIYIYIYNIYIYICHHRGGGPPPEFSCSKHQTK